MNVLYFPLESHIVDAIYEANGVYVLKIGNYYAVYDKKVEEMTDNEILAILLLYEKTLSKPRKIKGKIIRLPLLRLTRNHLVFTNGEMIIEGRPDENVKVIGEKELENYAFDLITYEWFHNSLRSEEDGIRTFIINFDNCKRLLEKNGVEIYECYSVDFGIYLVLNYVLRCVIAQSYNILLKLAKYALDIDDKTLELLKAKNVVYAVG